MIEEIRARIPSMAAWMESCYGSRPFLNLNDHIIESQCGVQQGDPLGPLGFALTLQPILERIRDELPELKINAWYLDDGTLCGSPDFLAAVIKIVEEDGPVRGLFLNRSKSLLHIPKDADLSLNHLPSEIPVTRGGFLLLGSPVGPPSFCESAVNMRVEKVQESLNRLTDLQRIHRWRVASCDHAFLSRKFPSHSVPAPQAMSFRLLQLLTIPCMMPYPIWLVGPCLHGQG